MVASKKKKGRFFFFGRDQRMLKKKALMTFRCPILQEVTIDPVVAGDGEIYDGETIRRYVQTQCEKFFSKHRELPATIRSPALNVQMQVP